MKSWKDSLHCLQETPSVARILSECGMCVMVLGLSQCQNHRLDLSLKLESLTLVSWLRFMLESEEMSEDLVVLEEREDLDMLGEESGSGPWSAK